MVDYLRVNWTNGTGISEEEAKYKLNMALNAGYYYEEVEEQHYQRKQMYCDDLNELYDKLCHTKVPIKQNLKKPLYQVNDLYKDPRFTVMETENGDKYILLSEWNLLNDLAVRLFVKEHIENIPVFEAIKMIKQHYQITDSNAFFFPHFDSRFTVRNNGKVSLKSYDDSHIYSFTTEVTHYIREEVARSTPKLISYLKEKYGEDVKIRSLIKAVFNIEVHYPKFSAYFLSVKEHLQSFPDTRLSSNGDSFIYIEQEDVNLVDKTLLQGITDTQLLDQKIQRLSTNVAADNLVDIKTEPVRQNQSRNSLTYTVRYYDRIQETLTAHFFKSWLSSDELHVHLILDNESFPLIFFYDHSHNVLHGTHLENLMSDYAIIPGQKLHFQIENNLLTLRIGSINEVDVKEQERYLDIARLAEENQLTGKSLLQLVTETLIYHPSGLHISEIISLVKKEMPYAESSIAAILSKHLYFEKVPDQKGFWIFNPAKWQKKIIKYSNPSVQKVDLVKDQKKHIPKKIKTMAEYFKEQAILAKKNRSRITNEMYVYMDKSSFLERAWTIYAYNIYKYAKKQASNEIPFEDYIQQAYFALEKAYENYKPSYKGSFYNYFKIYLTSYFRRYEHDRKNLIRIPVHRVEELEKFDKEAEIQLLIEGKADIYPSIDDDYTLFKTNYISFEELYHYVNQFENYEDDIMRGRIFSYFSKPTEYEPYMSQKTELAFMEEPDPDYSLYNELFYEETYDLWDKDFWSQLWDYLDQKSKSIPPSAVIMLRFGINQSGKIYTLEQVGEIYGVTRERIRQIEQKAMIKAQHYLHLKKYFFETFL